MLFGVLFEVLLTLWAQFSVDCRRVLDGWELGGMRFGVLAQARFWVLFGSGAGDSMTVRDGRVLRDSGAGLMLRWGAIGAAVFGC